MPSVGIYIDAMIGLRKVDCKVLKINWKKEKDGRVIKNPKSVGKGEQASIVLRPGFYWTKPEVVMTFEESREFGFVVGEIESWSGRVGIAGRVMKVKN